LESELDAEKSNVRVQTEKLNILRKEFTLLNEKLMLAEQENETMLNKLTSLTLKNKEFDELLQEKDNTIQRMQTDYEALLAQNNELKLSVENLNKKIEEMNQEIDRFQKVSKLISPKKPERKRIYYI